MLIKQSGYKLQKLPFRASPDEVRFGVSVTDEILSLLESSAPVAICVSGGKDSQASAIRVSEYLDSISHKGPRILVHSDLGSVEWKDSLPVCERLAKRLSLDLVVLRRKAGDMMERWETRWKNNVERYANLSSVKLILPWSTPSMRFCTSELKTAVITSDLVKRFPGQPIVSVSGIRHAESSARAKMPVAKVQPKLSRKGLTGWDWHPLIEWSTEDVYEYLEMKKKPLHEAYRIYGSSRVSCSFCIMGSRQDLAAATSCADNHDIYRRMVDLEIRSTFSLQSNFWLGDVASHLLPGEMIERLDRAKEKARSRAILESTIPKHLLFSKGVPDNIPTRPEAELLSSIRKDISDILGIAISHTDPDSIIDRYRDLVSCNTEEELGVDAFSFA